MKNITFDFESYEAELRITREEGYRLAIYDIIRYLESDKKNKEFIGIGSFKIGDYIFDKLFNKIEEKLSEEFTEQKLKPEK